MSRPNFSLDGRIALITGASSGIGAHLARLFAQAGAKVVLGARRVDRIAALSHAIGENALAVAMDVTDEASIVAAFDAAQARFGTPDTVLANAGMADAGRAIDLAVDQVRRVGRIVLTGSITAEMTGQGDSAYAASKAAVVHLGRQLAREWARQGINVNTVQPGYILTEIDADWFATEGGRAQVQTWPRKRLTPIEALNDPMLFFASDASAHVTGAHITVDDGQ